MEAAPLKRLLGTVCGSRGGSEARWSPDGLVHTARGVSGDSREAGTETADFGGTWTGRRAARAGGRAAAGPGHHGRLRPRCAEGTALRGEASVPCIAVSIHGGAAGAGRRAHGTPAASRVTAVRRGRCPCVWASCGQGLGSRAGQRLRRRAWTAGTARATQRPRPPQAGGAACPLCAGVACSRSVRAVAGGHPASPHCRAAAHSASGWTAVHVLVTPCWARERSCCGRGWTRTCSSPLRRCSVVFPAGARLLRAPATTAHEEAAVAMRPEPAAGGSGWAAGLRPRRILPCPAAPRAARSHPGSGDPTGRRPLPSCHSDPTAEQTG